MGKQRAREALEETTRLALKLESERDTARAHATALRAERDEAVNDAAAWQQQVDEAAGELNRLRGVIEEIALARTPVANQTEADYLIAAGWEHFAGEPFPWKLGSLEVSDTRSALLEQRRIEQRIFNGLGIMDIIVVKLPGQKPKRYRVLGVTFDAGRGVLNELDLAPE